MEDWTEDFVLYYMRRDVATGNLIDDDIVPMSMTDVMIRNMDNERRDITWKWEPCEG